MNRRTVLKGGIVVAACTPVLAVAPENLLPDVAELPVDKVHRLAEELAHALDEWNAATNVKFTAQVAPASSGLGDLLPQRTARIRIMSPQ